MRLRAVLLLVVVLGLSAGAGPAASASSLPRVRHVFVIVLENENGATTFGPSSPAPYLAHDPDGSRCLRAELLRDRPRLAWTTTSR